MGWTTRGASGRTSSTDDIHEAAQTTWDMAQEDDAVHTTPDGDR